ncbi:replication-relaxation family protein [Streptomyces halobius]|uniref:Replication-relaxation family protein n=1 Tax=Streptomyces halobius TaxID=2879846 RepID=A0ABY4M441_9ACTN|nr:replication-relaxation family protein [Streptomyces halobius]UQA92177.1 replication-relaxation family protein [Streptomyces halobius]
MPALPRPAFGPGSRYTARAATTRPRTTRHTDVAELARRLTARDLWLARMLYEHRVLTTDQLACLAHISLRSAQRRLRTLHQHAVLDSFRPLTATGSAPEHYTLGPLGAALLAAHAGLDTSALGWRPTHTGRIAYSPSLGHDLGVNELLTHLAAKAHTTPDTGLRLWLSERSTARRWGDIIRPDAYAHWHDGDRLLPFFLEYDTGSQPLPRVEAKLTGYAAFTTATDTRPALLIHTRTQSRDQALRHRLTSTARELDLHVATSSADFTTSSPSSPSSAASCTSPCAICVRPSPTPSPRAATAPRSTSCTQPAIPSRSSTASTSPRTWVHPRPMTGVCGNATVYCPCSAKPTSPPRPSPGSTVDWTTPAFWRTERWSLWTGAVTATAFCSAGSSRSSAGPVPPTGTRRQNTAATWTPSAACSTSNSMTRNGPRGCCPTPRCCASWNS